MWLGEGLGFTDFLRLETMPKELGCLSLSLAELPDHVGCTVHDRDGLIYVAVARKDVLAQCEPE